MGSDSTVELASGDVEYADRDAEDWTVTLVDTGDDAMTGARVKRVERYLGDADLFLCTYGDGLADVDIDALVAFHRSHGKLGDGHRRRARRRASASWSLDGDEVRASPRSHRGRGPDQRRLLRLRRGASSTGSRRRGLRARARAAGGRWPPTASCACYRHDGFWQCADTVRDVELLRALWERGGAPWRIWDDRSGAAPIPGDRRGAVHAVPEAALAPKDA